MKLVENKEKFIELRAKGYSFDKIANELNVSKQTLLNWNAKLKYEIDLKKCSKFDDLFSKYDETTETQLEFLLNLKNKILSELEKRSFENVNVIDLMNILNTIQNKLDAIKKYLESLKKSPEDDFKIVW